MTLIDRDMVRVVAPEDLRVGDHVVILDREHQLIPFPFGCDPDASPPAVTRLRLRHDRPMPLRVEDACLPLVLVRDVRKRHRILDLRRDRVGRLDPRFARAAIKALRPRRKARASGSGAPADAKSGGAPDRPGSA